MSPAPEHDRDCCLSDRRRMLRFYLNQRPLADILVGRQRIAMEAAQISDASAGGLGIRCHQAIRAPRGAPVTVATRIDHQVMVFTGQVASNRNGFDVGIEIGEEGQRRALAAFANEQVGVAVTMIAKDTARVTGRVSMAARHALGWAVDAGARSFDMGAATAVDSAGLGLLLMLRERHAVTIRRCSRPVCALISMTNLPMLCEGGCGGAGGR